MPLNDARRFIREIGERPALRAALGMSETEADIVSTLKRASYDCTFKEITEAYHGLDARCQSWEEAEQFKGVMEWWNFLAADVGAVVKEQ